MLDTATAAKDMFALLEDMATCTDDFHKAHDRYAKEFARIVTALIRSGEVTGTVTTTGSATTQTGPLTAGKIA